MAGEEGLGGIEERTGRKGGTRKGRAKGGGSVKNEWRMAPWLLGG